MNPRKLVVPALLAAMLAAAFVATPLYPSAPVFAQEEEERLPDETEDEFAVLDGLKDADIPMTFRFKDQPLREIFDTMADMVGISISYGDDFPFDRKVSVNLPNTTFPAALKSLARAQKLRYTIQEDNSLFVDAR